MGTNYYAVPNRPSIAKPIHIGKASIGWKFLFHDVDEPHGDVPAVWHSYEEVINWLQRNTVKYPFYVIMDEYEDIIPLHQFITMVELDQEYYRNNPDNFTDCRNVNGYRFYSGDFC